MVRSFDSYLYVVDVQNSNRPISHKSDDGM